MNKPIGSAIRSCRMKEELSQVQLSQLLGVRPALLCQWELGRKIPSFPTVMKIDEVFQGKLLDDSTVRPWACGGGGL